MGVCPQCKVCRRLRAGCAFAGGGSAGLVGYHDDSGVSELHVSKQYGEREGLVVRLVGNLEEGQDAGKKTADAVQPLKKRE